MALGKARPRGLGTRVFAWSNRFLQRTASRVVVLDRFMAEKLEARGPHRPATLIIPPWPLESERLGLAEGACFRRAHALEGKFVVMHSGNHSLAHPLRTLLDAARALRDDERIRFVFVGGGVGKREVEEALREGLPNVVSLPYQPLEKLAETLAAADVQVVAMGEGMVGCVHPCKVYGALAAARPVLYLGPARSHVGEIVGEGSGWRIAHGDAEGAVRLLRDLVGRPAAELAEIGANNRRLVEERFNAERLRAEFCTFVEQMVERR